MEENNNKYWPFIVMVAKIIGTETIVIIFFGLIFSNLNLISSLYFFGSAILMLIGIFPLWSDGGVRAYNKRKKVVVMNKNAEELKRKAEEKFISSISFALAGVFSFLLSMLTSKIL